MTALNPPGFMQARTDHSAATHRRNTMLLLDGNTWGTSVPNGGVHPAYGGGFAVTGSGAGMTVTVASGMAGIPHDTAFQGCYTACNDGNVNLSVDAADATQYRRDLVVLEVLDTADGDGSDEWKMSIVKGTNSASNPAPLPTAPDKSITIAYVRVDPGVTNLSGRVDDARRYIATLGGTMTGTDAQKPTTPRTGTMYTSTSGSFRELTYYDGFAYKFVADNGWRTYTPSEQGGGSATWSAQGGRYKYIGEKTVVVSLYMEVNVAGTGTDNLQFSLPVTPARNIRQCLMLQKENSTSSDIWNGVAFIFASGSGLWIDRLRLQGLTNAELTNEQGQDADPGQTYFVHGVYEVA